MEPNTAVTSAAGTSPAIVEQDLSTTHAQSLLSPPLFFQPPPEELVPAYGSGSGLPAVEYLPLSDDGHAASSSTFPVLGEVHRTGGGIFAQQEAPAANSFQAPLGGEPWEGPAQPSSSWAAPGMPAAFPVENAFLGLAAYESSLVEQIAAWESQSEMPSLVPPPSAGSGLPPPSSDVTWSAQPSSDYELPPLPESLCIPPPMEASTYNMPSTVDGSLMMMPWHCGGSSIETGFSISSVPDLTIGAMDEEPMLPVMPQPSFQGAAGASISNFAQPPPNSEVAPAPVAAILQEPVLPPVKKEPVDDDTAPTPSSDPAVLILLDDDEEDQLVPELDQPTAMGQSSETASKLPEGGYYASDGTTVAVGGSTRSQDSSSSKDIINSSSLSAIGVTTSSSGLPPMPPPPSIRAGASSSHSDAREVTFNDAELEILWKDKNLQELVYTDPKKVKRTIANRISFAKRKASKDKYTLELKHKVKELETKRNSVITELLLLQEECGELATQNMAMSSMAHELEQQENLKDAVRETLQAEIQNLNLIILNNALQTNPQMMMDGNNASGAHDLHQQMSTQITTGSASHTNNDVDQSTRPQMVQVQQLQIQEPQSEDQEAQAQESQQEDDFLLGGQQHPDT